MGRRFSYELQATDPENDLLAYYTTSDDFTINKLTGAMSFTPTIEQLGLHRITLVASDGDDFDQTFVYLQVLS